MNQPMNLTKICKELFNKVNHIIVFTQDIYSGHRSEVVFTQNPFYEIPAKSAVIKANNFKFPPFTISSYYSPLRAISEVKEGLVLRFASVQEYNQTHDQLLMQNIEHHLHTESEIKYPLLYRPDFFPVGENAILYDLINLRELMLYHDFEKVLLCQDMDVHLSVNLENLDRILEVFKDTPESVINEDYIASKTWVHPKSLVKSLKFLTKAKCIKPVFIDNGRIQIHKKGPGPKNDPFYHLIPEGEVTAAELALHLRMPRQQLFDFLKRYEGEHLIFSYVVNRNQRFYKFVSGIHEEIFEKTKADYYKEFEFLTSLASGGEAFLNRFLDDRINAHATENNIPCYIGDQLIGGLEKFVIPT